MKTQKNTPVVTGQTLHSHQHPFHSHPPPTSTSAEPAEAGIRQTSSTLWRPRNLSREEINDIQRELQILAFVRANN